MQFDPQVPINEQTVQLILAPRQLTGFRGGFYRSTQHQLDVVVAAGLAEAAPRLRATVAPRPP